MTIASATTPETAKIDAEGRSGFPIMPNRHVDTAPVALTLNEQQIQGIDSSISAIEIRREQLRQKQEKLNQELSALDITVSTLVSTRDSLPVAGNLHLAGTQERPSASDHHVEADSGSIAVEPVSAPTDHEEAQSAHPPTNNGRAKIAELDAKELPSKSNEDNSRPSKTSSAKKTVSSEVESLAISEFVFPESKHLRGTIREFITRYLKERKSNPSAEDVFGKLYRGYVRNWSKAKEEEVRQELQKALDLGVKKGFWGRDGKKYVQKK